MEETAKQSHFRSIIWSFKTHLLLPEASHPCPVYHHQAQVLNFLPPSNSTQTYNSISPTGFPVWFHKHQLVRFQFAICGARRRVNWRYRGWGRGWGRRVSCGDTLLATVASPEKERYYGSRTQPGKAFATHHHPVVQRLYKCIRPCWWSVAVLFFSA